MEWGDDDESNENAESLSTATDKSETSKVHHRKSFIPHKKRVILQELESISENNILEGCLDSSKSINFSLRLKKKNMNSESVYKSSISAESGAAQPETPPAALRQRILEAQEMQQYLEKELNELKDFTTNEKQVLAAEKGIEELRIQNSQLETSLNELKNKFDSTNTEKDLICKELEEIKRKYVDEQTEKQVLETKWKDRENDLKKSLEEAWSLLRIKEDRIAKMNEKISYLYSEREKVKDLNFTFGGQLLPTTDDYNIQTVETTTSEPFELCHDSLDNGRILNHNQESDCNGDNVQNNALCEVNILHEELAKYKLSIEMHKKQIEDLNQNLADKDLLISSYENNLSELENYLSDCLSNDLISVDIDNQTHKTSIEKIKYDIKFFLSQMEKGNTCTEKLSKVDRCNINLEPKECGDIGFISPCKSHEVDYNVDNKKNKVMVCQHSQTVMDYTTIISNEDQLYNKINETEREDIANDKIKEFKEEIKMIYKEKDVMYNQIVKYEEEIKNNDNELNILKIKLAEYEKGILKPTVVENSSQTVDLDVNDRSERVLKCIEDKSSDVSLDDGKEKLCIVEAENEYTLNSSKDKSYGDKININLGEINALQIEMSGYEEKIKNNHHEINAFKNEVSAYEEKIKTCEVETNMLQSKVVGCEETIKSNEDEIEILKSKVSGCEENIKNNEKEMDMTPNHVSAYGENSKNKEEEINLLNKIAEYEGTVLSNKEEINALQNSILVYKEKLKNNEEEINLMINKVSTYEETIGCKQEEINALHDEISRFEENKKEEMYKLQTNVSVFEEKIKTYEDEIKSLKTEVVIYVEKLTNKEEEIKQLHSSVVGHEEIISINKDETNNLNCKISEYKQKILSNEEEIKNLQDNILAYEAKNRDKDEELCLLLSKVSDYEDKLTNNKEEINTLKNNMLSYDENIKQKEEELNMLKNHIICLEETIRSNVEEINLLQKESTNDQGINALNDKVSNYEEKLKEKEDELNMLGKSVVGLEETIRNNVEEIDNLMTKVTVYQEKITVYEEEINSLKNEVIDYKEKLKYKEEEIKLLHSNVADHEEIININKDEMNILRNQISEYEEKIKCNEEEINKLQSNISTYQKETEDKKEEIKLLLSKVSGYEDKLANNEQEINALKDNLSCYDEKMKQKEDELNIFRDNVACLEETTRSNLEEMNMLQTKTKVYEEKITSYEEEINVLKADVSRYEEKLKEKEDELNMLGKSVVGLEETIRNNVEEIDNLMTKVSIYEEKLTSYEEEIHSLKNEVFEYEEKIKNKDEEINVLHRNTLDHGEVINIKKDEMNILQNKISEYEEEIKCKENEIKKLQSNIITHDEEVNLLLSKVSNYEDKLANNEKEINALQNNLSSCDEKMKQQEDDLNMLRDNVVCLEETIRSNLEEINSLKNEVFNYGEKLKNKDEEIKDLCSKVLAYKEKIQCNEDEINKLLSNISTSEKETEDKVEEINLLLNKVSGYEEKIKQKEEELDILRKNIVGFEETVRSNEEEIIALKNDVSNYEDKMKQKEEEISLLGENIIGLEEAAKNKIEEINIYQTKVSDYEEKIQCYQEEITSLQNEVSIYKNQIKIREEEMNVLRNNVVVLEETLKSNKEEIISLQNKFLGYEEKLKTNEEINKLLVEVSSYKEKIKNSDDKINMLESKISDYHENNSLKCEEIVLLQNKVSNYEKEIEDKEEQIKLLKTEVSDCAEKIKFNEEEIHNLKNEIFGYEERDKARINIGESDIVSSEKDSIEYDEKIDTFREETAELKNKVLCYENTIKSYADEINLLKNRISKYERAISAKLPIINVLSEDVKNLDSYGGFNNTVCSTISDNISVSYSQNDLVDVEYDIQPSADNTLNFTTLDSTSQLEQSIFISKLPQTDISLKESDPLASDGELSYTNEELENTLIDQFSKSHRFENNVLHGSNLINTTYENYNANENIKALICLLNSRGDMSNDNFDDISKQLLAVKKILKPEEDYIIFSFCQIIENLLNKEFVNKRIWNEKMLVVKETLSNLQNIKDSFLKLKNSFCSLENITSQDYETINSHFKNLFMCNRELSAENILLKEQLKVSLLSEEKLSKINELLRSDLTSMLQTEKDLKIITDCNKNLEDKLQEICKKESDIISLVDKIANLLNPNLSLSDDQIIKKLEQIYSLLMESICEVECEDIHELGFICFFRNIVSQNSVLKQNIHPNIKTIKGDLASLNVDITHQFKNLNDDFYSISRKLAELYEKQEEESSSNNFLRDNVKNLVLENKELKEELCNLRIQNNDLRSTSEDYSILLDKYKYLNDVVQEKDDLLSDQVKFQEQVCLFVDSLKDLFFMKNFQQFNSSFSFTDKSKYIDFLEWLKTFLKEVHCIHESLLQNIKSQHHFNLSEVVSEVVREKNNINDAYHALNSEFQIIKQSLMLFPENISSIKNILNDISSEVLQSKYSFIQDILSINKNVETLLLSYHQRDIDHDNYKCNSEKSYNDLNEKYLELLHSYEDMELELKSSRSLIQEFIQEKEELKRKASDHDSKNNELREMISNYETELLNCKNVHSTLERKIIDVENEKKLLEENFKQYVSLGEYNNLKADKNKLTEIIQNLNNLNCTLKETCGDLISCDIKNLGDDFIHLKNIIYSLLEVRNKYTTLELNYSKLMSERNESLSKIESLNSLLKESLENQNTLKSEIQALIEKDKEQKGSLYFEKVTKILMLLGYEEPTKIDDLAWTFIEESISKYKLMVNQNTENDNFKLEEKIMFLESQLCDAQDFKSKFSKELHMLKPDLDISYLMSLSLADLQKTMIIAIIEKEKDVIGDYEMKLALSTDKIQQLEEQQKRREDWLQEIEKENERLTNECKQIQDDNEILKADVNLKIRKIIDLEHQITQQINKEQIKEYIKERDDSNNQLETAANEKNTLRLSIASLNEKLQNKSIECEEVYNSLQKKAEVIFGLEKVLSKCKTENANLEKEVLHLRESMLLNLNNFNDNKQALERDLANYKVQIEKLHQLLSDTQKQITTENKSVSTDLDEDVKMELKLKCSLSNHLSKIESLNLKIDDLNSQLKQQNNKFDEEFENQAKFIESLEKELNMSNKLNAELKNNLILIHNQEMDSSQHSNFIEGLQSEIISLKERNSLLENEKTLLLNDKELLKQSRIMLEEKESLVDNLKKEVEFFKSKLSEKEDEKNSIQEQIDNLLLKLDSVSNELISAQNQIKDLLKMELDNKQLKDEVTSLISELEQCKIEVSTLIKENEMKEVQLSECFSNLNLEKEISCSLKSTLEQVRQEMLNLKTEKALLIEEQYKDLESQKYLCSKLNSDLCQLKEINALQENELLSLKNELREKVAILEEIRSHSHLEKSCPFKKEADDLKNKNYDINKQLEHERETFKLWKTNLEEDLHCKLLKISDLELKLKKETQCYKEALMSNSELHQKLQESLEKFKKLEDKMAIQRDVFIKEKGKSEMDLQNKEKMLIELEEKLLSVKHKCEELSKDICMFLEKLSVMLQVDVVDLSSAVTLINNLTAEKEMLMREFKITQEKCEQLEKVVKETQEKVELFEKELKRKQDVVLQLKEELRETQEKAEQLEEECEELNNDIKYHENEIGNLYKNGKLQEEKWMKEKEELKKELLQTQELKEKLSSQEKVILALQTKIENYDKSLITFNAEKKILESEKLELERKIVDLEKSLQSLKNQEISYLDGIKREMNHLKLELFNKNKAISKLEMRLESDTLPFQKKAELAERKVDELTKELRILKQSQSLKQMSSVLTSPMAGAEMSYSSQKNKDEIIERLEQEVKQLVREKSALKLLAQNRRVQINELREQLGKKICSMVNQYKDKTIWFCFIYSDIRYFVLTGRMLSIFMALSLCTNYFSLYEGN